MKTIIISGAQSSGKITLFNHLQRHVQSASFQPEINPYTIMGANLPGSAFATNQIQKRIMDLTLSSADRIYHHKPFLTIWETGLTNLAYVKNMDLDWFNQLKDKMIPAFARINSIIIYIKTSPDRCWLRRQDDYLNRIKRYLKENQITDKIKQEQIIRKRLKSYKDHLFIIHSLFNEVIRDLPFPVYQINNDHDQLDTFLSQGLKLIKRIINK